MKTWRRLGATARPARRYSFAMRCAAPILLLACLPAMVQAQTLQSLVVGADVAVAIPPRGSAAVPPPPRPVAPPPAIPVAVAEPSLAAGGAAGAGLAAGPLPLLLPLAAALALGGGLPGSGGSGSAPATTR